MPEYDFYTRGTKRMKLIIKRLSFFASLLVIPAIAASQNPLVESHVKVFSKAIDNLNKTKIESETALVSKSLLQTKSPDEIKKNYDKLSNFIIKQKIGNPTTITLDHLAKKDAWEANLKTNSTQEQAELIALKGCTFRHEKIALARKKAYTKDLNLIADSMNQKKTVARQKWLQGDYQKNEIVSLKEQLDLEKLRSQKFQQITQEYDQIIRNLSKRHFLDFIPAERNVLIANPVSSLNFKTRYSTLKNSQAQDRLEVKSKLILHKASEEQLNKQLSLLDNMHKQERSNLVAQQGLARRQQAPNVRPPASPGFFTRLKNNWYQLFSNPR